MARQRPSNHEGRTCQMGTRAHPYKVDSQSHGGVAASGGQLLDLIPGCSRPGDDNATPVGIERPSSRMLSGCSTTTPRYIYT